MDRIKLDQIRSYQSEQIKVNRSDWSKRIRSNRSERMRARRAEKRIKHKGKVLRIKRERGGEGGNENLGVSKDRNRERGKW